MSEDIDKLNASVRELNDVMRSLSGQMIDLADSTSQVNKVSGTSTQRQQQTADALQRLRTNAEGLSEVEKSRIEAQKKLLAYEQQLADAGRKAGDSLKGFASGILDTNVKLTNLNQGLASAGDAAFALGKAFGPLGMLIGGAVKGFTMLIEANLKISQAYLEGKDQLNKMGAAGAHTKESLQNMAREADLNAETIGRMIKPMQSMGQGIMSLGSTAGEGQKAFAKLIKTTDEERARMSRLGIDQEQMMQGQADYLALQAASGRNLKAESIDREKLRKSSLEYQVNLMELSALTGKDAQTLKDRQKDMLANRQVQLKTLQDQVKERSLREQAAKETDQARKEELLAKANALKEEIDNRNQAFSALAGAPEALRKGIQQLSTGTTTGAEAQVLKRMPEMGKAIAEFNKTIKEGGDQQKAAAKLQQEYQKSVERNVAAYGRTAAINEDVAKVVGLANTEDLQSAGARIGEDYTKDQEKIRKDLAEAQKKGTDADADARAKLQNANIALTGKMEDVISTLNPLKLGLLGLGAAAGAAALALGVMAKKGLLTPGVAGGGGGITGMLGGMLGSGKSAPTPTVPSAGGAGAGAAGGVVQGLGQGGGNLLEGAAKGLRAFANPQVALGAAGFGVAIAAVGAGLAGATWIMGKALPTLSEGLGAFTKLDGPKLKATGEGILELGKGMAVFGVGGAAAGIGSIIGNMSEGITKFFGGSTPIDKLVEFSNLNIDPKKTKENAEAFVAFSDAMSKYKGGADSSITQTISDNVVSFMGGDNDAAFTKFSKFAKIDIGEPGKVKKNAQAFVYFNQALSEFKGGGELRNIADNMLGGLNKLFGGDSVTDKFVKFTKLDVDPEKAGRLAEAFSKYASSMNTLSTGGSAAASKVVASGAAARPASSAPAGGSTPSTGGAPASGGARPASGGGGGGTASPVTAQATKGGGDSGASGAAARPASSAPAGGGTPSTGGAPASGGARPTSSGGGGGGTAAPVTAQATKGGGDSGASGGKDSGGAPSAVPVKLAGAKGGSLSEQEAKAMTMKHEGIRTRPYKDSLGLWTVGVGHLIGDGRTLPDAWNREFSMEEVMKLYDEDYDHHKKQAQANVPGFNKFDSMGQGALVDLTFNMGPGWPKKFPNTSKKLAAGDTEGAAEGLQDSLWYSQVKSRGPTIVDMVRNSKVSARDGGLATGPETGYPATLHGNEMIVPLDPNSLLAELGKKTSAEIETKMAENKGGNAVDPESLKELTSINQAMLDVMSSKLDAVISRLETGNDTQGKLLKYSQA